MAPKTRATPEEVAAELAADGRYVDNTHSVRHRLKLVERDKARARAASDSAVAAARRAQTRIDEELKRRDAQK